MSDSSNICLSCGLCCDGTLIGFVHLDKEELPELRKIKDIEESNGTGFFLNPCNSLGCDGCTIYAQRPKKCDEFNCQLLGSIDQKETSFDSALELIRTVKLKKASIEKKIETLGLELRSQSFHFKILELQKLLNSNEAESSTQNNKALIAEIDILDELILENFGVTLS